MLKRVILTIFFALTCQAMTLNAQVGFNYDVNVSDAPAFLFAMNSYMNSSEGSSGSASVALRQNLANGLTKTTHNIAVIWPDFESMQRDTARNATSAQWAAFQASLAKVATIESNVIFSSTGLSTSNSSMASSPNQFKRFINFRVEPQDVASYTEALTELWEACDDSVHHALFSLFGSGETGFTHAVVQTAASAEDLLDGTACSTDATVEFFSEVSEIREVMNDFVAVQMATW